DAAGNAYIAGTTGSGDFPTVNPLQASLLTFLGVTGFVSKLSPDGSSLIYSTYLGGSINDAILGIAVDGQGNVYVTGETQSEDFPTTARALQEHAGFRAFLRCTPRCSIPEGDRRPAPRLSRRPPRVQPRAPPSGAPDRQAALDSGLSSGSGEGGVGRRRQLSQAIAAMMSLPQQHAQGLGPADNSVLNGVAE